MLRRRWRALLDGPQERRAHQQPAGQQAQDAGADTIVTGCAYCLHMMQDSLKLLNYDDHMRAIDLSCLMLESLEEKR